MKLASLKGIRPLFVLAMAAGVAIVAVDVSPVHAQGGTVREANLGSPSSWARRDTWMGDHRCPAEACSQRVEAGGGLTISASLQPCDDEPAGSRAGTCVRVVVRNANDTEWVGDVQVEDTNERIGFPGTRVRATGSRMLRATFRASTGNRIRVVLRQTG